MTSNSGGAQFAVSTKNLMTAEPFTKRGRQAFDELGISSISESAFFSPEGLYVEPFTGNDDRHNELDSPDADDFFTYSATERLISLRNRELDFVNQLKTLGASLFMISGEAGCGKTTYLRRLKSMIEREEGGGSIQAPYVFHIYDFEVWFPSLRLNGASYYFGTKTDGSLWKLVSSATKEAFRIISYNDDETLQAYQRRIGGYAGIYESRFLNNSAADEEEFEIFFGILTDSAPGLASSDSIGKLGADVVSFIEKLYSRTDGKGALAFMIGLLVRLYFCISRADNSKHLCVFDNIEYFLQYSDESIYTVMEHELRTIYDCIADALDRVYAILADIRVHEDRSGRGYETFFGFLIVCRRTSRHFFRNDHSAIDRKINISDWFCPEHVFQKRQAYFSDRIVSEQTCEYWKAFNNIIQDRSLYKWGLHEIVNQMYNCSKRRIVRIVSMALASLTECDVRFFNEQWEKAFAAAGNDDYISASRHMCRRYILAILLRIIKREHLESLKINTKPEEKREYEHNEYSYARKIAAYLYNKETRDSEYSVEFTGLARAVLQFAYINNAALIDVENVKKLAHVLYQMNERRWEITNWGALITVEEKDLFLQEEQVFVQRMMAAWHEQLEAGELYKCNIRIELTDAGRLFARRIVPDFEFIARRCAFDYGPVFPLMNPRHPKPEADRVRSLSGIIDIVWKNAMTGVNGVLDSEKVYYTPGIGLAPDYRPVYRLRDERSWLSSYKEEGDDRAPTTHAMRVMQLNIGYIRSIILFMTVNGVAPDSVKTMRAKLSAFCLDARNLITGNEGYFDFEKKQSSDAYKFVAYLDKLIKEMQT